MLPRPIDATQAGFLAALDRACRSLGPGSPLLGGSAPCDVRPGEPQELINPHARFTLLLSGGDHHAISVRGQRVDVELQPGQCIYWSADSWSIPFRDRYGEAFGVVFWQRCVRLIQMIFQAEHGTPAWFYHTAHPIGEAGVHVIRAMNRLAEDGQAGPIARQTLLLLMRMVRQHLAEDLPAATSHPRALATWDSVRAHLEESYAGPITRGSVARAFDLHPNYLSALARQSAGLAFHEVLDQVRITHARRLLRDTNLKLARIAAMCGYHTDNRFSKVFKRVVGITPGRFRAASAENKPASG